MAVVLAPKAPQVFLGLSSDTKPLPAANTPNTAPTSLAQLGGVSNAAVFYATDTAAWYIYDAAGAGWVLTGSSAMA